MAEPYHIEGETGLWHIVAGLEIHAQVSTHSKLFSGSATAFGAPPNQQVSLVDAAMPGMLPVLNGACVTQAVRTGLALGAVIHKRSIFARKNYFYADLPQGYQISQYEHPIVGEGAVEIVLPDGTSKSIGIERIHLEQDAGKSVHDRHPSRSYIDLNRAGVPLMEIVSKPDIRSPEEAVAFVAKVRSILRTIGACDGNMAEGSLRVDANISVRRPGEALGTRAELKNINSLRFLRQAMAYEAQRQVRRIEDGGTVRQETRLFDKDKGTTRSMRGKEDAHDYRYFPDPDLPPLVLSDAEIEAARQSLPELPDARMARFQQDYELSEYDAGQLVAEREIADYFEAAVQAGGTGKAAANWILSELFARLNKAGLEIDSTPVSAQNLGALLQHLDSGQISGKMAKDVFDAMFETGQDPTTIIREQGLEQVSDAGALEAIIADILTANPQQVAQYRAGKTGVLGWFVGQAMKATRGQGNPQMVNTILRTQLDGEGG